MNYVSSSIELDNICFEGQMHIPNKGSTGFKIDSFNLELLDKYYNYYTLCFLIDSLSSMENTFC